MIRRHVSWPSIPNNRHGDATGLRECDRATEVSRTDKDEVMLLYGRLKLLVLESGICIRSILNRPP